MKKLIHRIAHLLGWNCGHVETYWANNGKLMVGFRCSCGELMHIAPSYIKWP